MTSVAPLSRPGPVGLLPTPVGKSDLRSVAECFEAMFVRQMLAAARKAEFGGDALFGSQGLATFTEMLDARFAELASGTSGFGIADLLEAQLARQMNHGAQPARVNAGRK